MFELISKGTCANCKKFHHLEIGFRNDHCSDEEEK